MYVKLLYTIINVHLLQSFILYTYIFKYDRKSWILYNIKKRSWLNDFDELKSWKNMMCPQKKKKKKMSF